jgi:hypothetical protein
VSAKTRPLGYQVFETFFPPLSWSPFNFHPAASIFTKKPQPMASLSSEAAIRETIMRLARKLPTSPHIFGRLGGLLNDINSDLDSIVKLVAVDQGLTARIIR